MFLNWWFLVVIFPPLGKKKIEKSEKESKGKDDTYRHVHQINSKNAEIKNT